MIKIIAVPNTELKEYCHQDKYFVFCCDTFLSALSYLLTSNCKYYICISLLYG